MKNGNYQEKRSLNRINRKALTTAALLGIMAAAFSIFMVRNAYFPGDLPVTEFCQSLASGPLTSMMSAVAYIFGGWRAALLVVVFIILTAWRMGKARAGLIALAGLITTSNYLFKALIDRPRPSTQLVQVLAKESGQSFPSSHAFFSMLVLGSLIYLLSWLLQ